MGKSSCHPLSERKFSIEVFVNFKNFPTDVKSCLAHYEAQIFFFFCVAENLSPVIRKGKILLNFENFKIYQNLYGKPLNRDWLTRVVFTVQALLGGVYMRKLAPV